MSGSSNKDPDVPDQPSKRDWTRGLEKSPDDFPEKERDEAEWRRRKSGEPKKPDPERSR